MRYTQRTFPTDVPMALHLKMAKVDLDITVVQVSGKMTFEASDALPARIAALLDSGTRKLILELSGVDQIDSIGAVALVRCFFAAREAEAAVCVACAGQSITQLFTTTLVNGVIPFFPTIPAAYEHFSSNPSGGTETADPARSGQPAS